MVTHVEFAKMIDAIRPWIDYGIDVATGKLKVRKRKSDEDDEEAGRAEPSAMHANGIRRAAGPPVPGMLRRRLRSATAITYEEEGVWVTHSETHIQDLK